MRINEDIRAKEVRLISETGEQLGIVPIEDAIVRAEDVNLDLVEVGGNSNPPVCKLLNFGKIKYEQKKKAHQSKKKQHVIKVKEIRVRPSIGEHDLMTKVNQGRKFLLEGNKLKVTIMFRGRELSRVDLGMEVLERIVEMLDDISEIEKQTDLEGRRMNVVLTGR
ncbi:MAG: translation initiation factor IF-3 [Candidatus Marinimicrobia bacterium]|nr:translation initiation factor IF-3 [Candidatus Neomarinimicrobiota bacterium]MDP6788930.1 translation initiation factor IF-3 [Candidatus Neomarinimicrobiota bacterium]MDP7072294.1 translation initiation factor IF-3 [Candidatus Neomarinimicrobiota bacterium]